MELVAQLLTVTGFESLLKWACIACRLFDSSHCTNDLNKVVFLLLVSEGEDVAAM